MNITINIFGDVYMNCDCCGYCDCLDEDFDEEYTEQEDDSADTEQTVSPEEVKAVIKTVLEALFPKEALIKSGFCPERLGYMVFSGKNNNKSELP